VAITVSIEICNGFQRILRSPTESPAVDGLRVTDSVLSGEVGRHSLHGKLRLAFGRRDKATPVPERAKCNRQVAKWKIIRAGEDLRPWIVAAVTAVPSARQAERRRVGAPLAEVTRENVRIFSWTTGQTAVKDQPQGMVWLALTFAEAGHGSPFVWLLLNP
jgi:hypothetical protein